MLRNKEVLAQKLETKQGRNMKRGVSHRSCSFLLHSTKVAYLVLLRGEDNKPLLSL